MFFLRDYYIAFCLGFLLDLIIGDPEWLYHPVRLIGWLISFLEKVLYPGRDDRQVKKGDGSRAADARLFLFVPFIKGLILTLLVLYATAGVTAAILYFAYKLGTTVFIIAAAIMTWQCLAVKSLKTESMKVCRALENKKTSVTKADNSSSEDLKEARSALSMIVGRDTDCLNKDGIIRAAVETVAEGSCDGVMAPIIYLAIGGPVLGFFYKAVNTMDSMIGYRNERYEFFGKAAARLDDVMNFIPARIAAFLLIAAAFFNKETDGMDAFRIWRYDGNRLDSVNAAQTEAAASGALRLRLAGDTVYGGMTVRKPYIGEVFGREAETEDIRRINSLMYVMAFLGIAVSILFVSIVKICLGTF